MRSSLAYRQVFRVLGTPPAALQLSLGPESTASLRNGVVLSTTDAKLNLSTGHIQGPADIILGLRGEPAIVNTSDWVLKSAYVAATSQGQSVATARRGVFRVDVPSDESLIVKQDAVVGYTSPGHVVYWESRFDLFRAWSKWMATSAGARIASSWDLATRVYQASALQTRKTYKFLRGLFTSGSVPSEPLPSPSPSAVTSKLESSPPTVRRPNPTLDRISISIKEARAATRTAYNWTASKLFYWTHPPKLRFQGPCSVLIKP